MAKEMKEVDDITNVEEFDLDVKVTVGNRETAPSKYIVMNTPRWKAELTENQSNNLKEDVAKLLDQRKNNDADKRVYEFFISKMQYKKFKADTFDKEALLFMESLNSMVESWRKYTKLHVRPKQKGLDE